MKLLPEEFWKMVKMFVSPKWISKNTLFWEFAQYLSSFTISVLILRHLDYQQSKEIAKVYQRGDRHNGDTHNDGYEQFWEVLLHDSLPQLKTTLNKRVPCHWNRRRYFKKIFILRTTTWILKCQPVTLK